MNNLESGITNELSEEAQIKSKMIDLVKYGRIFEGAEEPEEKMKIIDKGIEKRNNDIQKKYDGGALMSHTDIVGLQIEVKALEELKKETQKDINRKKFE